MTYARARLWLGITSVGTWVVLSAAALFFELPTRVFPTSSTGIAGDAAWLAFAVLLSVGVGFGFDLLGGFLLPRRFGRSSAGSMEWFLGWVRGVVALGLGAVFLALITMALARSFGVGGAIAAVAAATLLLVIFQGPQARWVGQLARERESGLTRPRLHVVRNRDRGFTGGWVGWPGRERLVVPATWLDDLDPEQLEAEIQRREIVLDSGARARGVWLGLAFNLGGFALVATLAGVDLSTVAGIVSVALWMTLWSFFGALVLPSLSRPAVYAADRLARDAGTSPGALAATIRRLDELQDDEPDRPIAVETVFHPIPARKRRLERLGEEHSGGVGAWHAARLALYLSGASFGLLGRAVHCNCGRPELWVLLPAD